MKTKAYNCMKILIKNRRRGRETLLGMLDVYYAAGRLNDTQFMELTALVDEYLPATEATETTEDEEVITEE